MFIFNTDLLLYNVQSWFHILAVFVTGVLAMFSFAAMTQNFLIAKNRIHEAVLLGVVTLILLRPQLFIRYLDFGSKAIWYGIGIALFGCTFLIQYPRVRLNPGRTP